MNCFVCGMFCKSAKDLGKHMDECIPKHHGRYKKKDGRV